MKKIIFIIILMNIMFGCRLPKLGIEKKDIKPGIIRTDGFYYNKPDYLSFMLYQNGVFSGDFGVSDKEFESAKRQFIDSSYYKYSYEMPYAWGLFEIKADSIFIEHWQSREWAAYGKSKYAGVIINDSTLLLNHPVVGKDTFYFYYLPVKPDSTNKYIK